MLRQIKNLQDLAIVATNGAIGEVTDFYFDDEAWAIGYLVVDADSCLSSRKLLISPIAAGKPDWAQHSVAVDITRDALKQAPRYDPALPLAREMEIAVYSTPGTPGTPGTTGTTGAKGTGLARPLPRTGPPPARSMPDRMVAA